MDGLRPCSLRATSPPQLAGSNAQGTRPKLAISKFHPAHVTETTVHTDDQEKVDPKSEESLVILIGLLFRGYKRNVMYVRVDVPGLT